MIHMSDTHDSKTVKRDTDRYRVIFVIVIHMSDTHDIDTIKRYK